MTENPSYYSIIPATVRYDNSLKANEKLLYGEITSLASATGACWATNAYFAKLYGVTNIAVSNWIKDLIDKGYLARKDIKGPDGKEQKRVLCITPLNKSLRGVKQNFNTPLKQIFKENNTSINNTSINKTHSADKSAQRVLKDEFEQLWKNYPNKKGKNTAFNHYKAWRKKSVKNTNEYLEQKLADYLRYCELNKNWYHPMNGSTWFNGRFDDDLEIDKPKSNPKGREWF